MPKLTIDGNEISMSFPEGAVSGGQSAGIELRRAVTSDAIQSVRPNTVRNIDWPAGAFTTSPSASSLRSAAASM